MSRQRMFGRVLAGTILAGGLLGIGSFQARGQETSPSPRQKWKDHRHCHGQDRQGHYGQG